MIFDTASARYARCKQALNITCTVRLKTSASIFFYTTSQIIWMLYYHKLLQSNKKKKKVPLKSKYYS